MYRSRPSRIWPAALLLALLAAWLPLNRAPCQSSAESAEELIRQLGSKQYRVRQRASRLLGERKDTTVALQEALRLAAGDLEVKRRIEVVLKKRARRFAPVRLKRLKTAVKDGAVDVVAELLAEWPAGYEEAACWAEMRTLENTLLDLFGKRGGQVSPGFLQFSKSRQPRVIAEKRVVAIGPYDGKSGKCGPLFVRTTKLQLEYANHDDLHVACSGKVHAGGTLSCSAVVFAANSVNMAVLPCNGIIVSDGDVSLLAAPSPCLIIARGTVTSRHCRLCHVYAKRVDSDEKHFMEKCKIVEGETFPLGFVKFFSLQREGLSVERAKGGVLVRNVRAGKRFAKAGLHRADRIVAVDGKAVDSEETLRRLVRYAWANDYGLTLRFERDSKTREVWVDSPW